MHYLCYKDGTGEIVGSANVEMGIDELRALGNLIIEAADHGTEGYVDVNTLGFVGFPAKPSPHHTFDYTLKQWVDPRTLADVKALKSAEINAARNAEITGGFTYMGKLIDSDRDSVMAITGAATAALAAKAAALPYSVTWTCSDNTTLTLDADGVLGMSVTLAQYADAKHTRGRPLKDAVAAATTAAEVEAISW